MSTAGPHITRGTPRNRWKPAFFALLVVWLATLVAAGYAVLDQSVTLTHMREGYGDCEAHRDVLHTLLKGRVDRSTVEAMEPRPSGGVEFQYDAGGHYRASRFGASGTPDLTGG